ncbi:hypothetical protein CMQ_123 [Grosmannia clavigera kw1407]|uniref:Uncharacterized protein n=1 Tax=Grosmannia clavigera (strain kw1407 / UAMH 11150) TaxID=655863 RepID=F0XQM1_GROCL|nr:uncharacterized protein CMQ_123 [Grosmannia clavigera kw1407]EFW99805.1 hypothetical protein CMQ_123 [Grosmannia clavigera kw1407]
MERPLTAIDQSHRDGYHHSRPAPVNPAKLAVLRKKYDEEAQKRLIQQGTKFQLSEAREQRLRDLSQPCGVDAGGDFETGHVLRVKYAPGDEIRQQLVRVVVQWHLTDKMPLLNRQGILTQPQVPDVLGLFSFAGSLWHTAQWNYGLSGFSPTDARLTRLQDKLVAVVPEVAVVSDRAVRRAADAAADVATRSEADQPGVSNNGRDGARLTASARTRRQHRSRPDDNRQAQAFNRPSVQLVDPDGRGLQAVTPGQAAYIREILLRAQGATWSHGTVSRNAYTHRWKNAGTPSIDPDRSAAEA